MNSYEIALFFKRRRFRSSLSNSQIISDIRYGNSQNISIKPNNQNISTNINYDTPLLQQLSGNQNKQSVNIPNIGKPMSDNERKEITNNIVKTLSQGERQESASYKKGPMHFTMEDYLNAGQEKHTKESMSPEHYKNAESLIRKINIMGNLLDTNSTLSSGYRTAERQRQIYAEKGQNPVMNSYHLTGHALDINDPTGRLKRKIKSDRKILEKAKELGLYFENFNETPNWVHIQDMPPKIVGRQIWSADNFLQRLN